MIRVFYDGQCSLCSREINYYKKIAPPNQFDWIDITQDATPLESLGINYSTGLRLLHTQDSAGTIHIGIESFISIWNHLKGWRILAKIINLPLIRPIANLAYNTFASWRFNRLDHCQIAQEKDKHK